MKSILWMLMTGLLLSANTPAQVAKRISGKVVDAATGEPLAAAHVIIKGTYTGTIANADGEFSLMVRNFPATIVARFIGFETQEQTIDRGFEGELDFLMKEAVVQMEQLTVTGEDPALSIMKEVIRRKKIWWEKLKTYKAEAYSRQQLLNDTTIVSISESVSEAYWDHEKGPREVLLSRRQTANIEGADNFAGVSYLPNFYADELDIAGFDIVGITDERALKYYNFKLVDYRSIDDKVVYEIEVAPKRKYQPLFEGTIFVLDEEFALLSVKLKPNHVVVFPPPIQDFNLYYEQQFSNFGGEFWLPVDVRIEGKIKVGVVGLRFPPIGFKQVSKMNDYEVNIELPDSLYKDWNWFRVDSTTINKPDSIFTSTIDPVPLSTKEEQAYSTLDSTATLAKAFKPKGFFARFIEWEDENNEEDNNVSVSSGENRSSDRSVNSGGSRQSNGLSKFGRNLSVNARYNRAETFFGSITHIKYYFDNRLSSKITLGYNLGYQEVTHGVALSWWPLKKTRRFGIGAGYLADTRTSYESDLFNMSLTSALPLFGSRDYFDYYRNTGGYLRFSYRPQRSLSTYQIAYNYEDHRSIDYKSSYDLIGRDYIQRMNPPIEEGRLSSLTFLWMMGDQQSTFGAIGVNGFKFSVEQAFSFIGSDWDFTRFELNLNKQFTTFYKKRFLPNTLDIRINAGTYLGDLPVQENGTLDVALGYFTPFGAFRSRRYVPYQGGSYAAVNMEHNFRSVPFEMLGWLNAPKTGLSIIAFGGVGKTWNSTENLNRFNIVSTQDIHAEVGLSLSNVFSLFRLDLAFRIDDPGFYPGISVARFF